MTYERWINLFLPNGWHEREEMGFVLLEKEAWPGLVQLTFLEREETKQTPSLAAKVMLEDTLEDRDIPFPREAVKVEERPDMGIATIDYMLRDEKDPTHWRIWFLADRTRAIMVAYICNPEYDHPSLEEMARIVADIEFIPSTND